LIDKGLFTAVVLHEMAHCLGVGTMWPTVKSGCAKQCSPQYKDYKNVLATGVCIADTKFKAMGTTTALRLETQGSPGDGTYCSHWSEEQLGDELMTGKQQRTIINCFYNCPKCNC
jgi:Leishmanolysin